MSERVTDEQAEAAKGVLYRAYRQWVVDTANGLIRALLEEIDTGEDFDERLDEVTDSAMTYTRDQYDVIYSSESTDEALHELEDMGVSTPVLGAWAVTAFRIDVRDALSRNSAAEELLSIDNREERIDWLIETHGHLFYRKGKTMAYLVSDDQNEALDLGVLVREPKGDSFHSVESVRRGKWSPELAVALDALEDSQESRFIEAER